MKRFVHLKLNYQMENKRNNTSFILLLALVLLSASMVFLASRYISKLERQIYQRDSLIRELSISDELVKEYFNIEIDSSGHKISYSLKEDKKTRVVERIETIKESQFSFDGETISPDEVVKRYYELQDKTISLSKEYQSLINKYNTLADRFNSNYKIIDSLRTAKNISDLELNTIQNAYGIKASCDVSGNTYKFSLHGTKQIDSALLLLPYYRDYINYDPKDNSWNVELPMKRGTVKIQTK